MKKLLVTLIALMGLGVSGLAFADLADGAGIKGSPHDFADNRCWDGVAVIDPATKGFGACDETTAVVGWNDSQELCKVCHVPHDHGRTAPFMSNGVLWNHDNSQIGTWTPYDSPTMEAATALDPDGMSLACLGCHDGASAISAFDLHAIGNGGTPMAGQVMGTSGTAAAAGSYVMGGGTGDISQNHPVSVVFVEGAAAGMNLLADTFGTGGTRDIASVLDSASKVQCSSCHDVHNNSVANQWLLRLPVQDATNPSDLCLACHDK